MSISVAEADSVPALTGGIIAQIASLAYGVPASGWHGSGVEVAEPSTGVEVPDRKIPKTRYPCGF